MTVYRCQLQFKLKHPYINRNPHRNLNINYKFELTFIIVKENIDIVPNTSQN